MPGVKFGVDMSMHGRNAAVRIKGVRQVNNGNTSDRSSFHGYGWINECLKALSWQRDIAFAGAPFSNNIHFSSGAPMSAGMTSRPFLNSKRLFPARRATRVRALQVLAHSLFAVDTLSPLLSLLWNTKCNFWSSCAYKRSQTSTVNS